MGGGIKTLVYISFYCTFYHQTVSPLTSLNDIFSTKISWHHSISVEDLRSVSEFPLHHNNRDILWLKSLDSSNVLAFHSLSLVTHSDCRLHPAIYAGSITVHPCYTDSLNACPKSTVCSLTISCVISSFSILCFSLQLLYKQVGTVFFFVFYPIFTLSYYFSLNVFTPFKHTYTHTPLIFSYWVFAIINYHRFSGSNQANHYLVVLKMRNPVRSTHLSSVSPRKQGLYEEICFRAH